MSYVAGITSQCADRRARSPSSFTGIRWSSQRCWPRPTSCRVADIWRRGWAGWRANRNRWACRTSDARGSPTKRSVRFAPAGNPTNPSFTARYMTSLAFTSRPGRMGIAGCRSWLRCSTALRRAARFGDGWIGDGQTFGRARGRARPANERAGCARPPAERDRGGDATGLQVAADRTGITESLPSKDGRALSS